MKKFLFLSFIVFIIPVFLFAFEIIPAEEEDLNEFDKRIEAQKQYRNRERAGEQNEFGQKIRTQAQNKNEEENFGEIVSEEAKKLKKKKQLNEDGEMVRTRERLRENASGNGSSGTMNRFTGAGGSMHDGMIDMREKGAGSSSKE
jgi:hypothetical protein